MTANLVAQPVWRLYDNVGVLSVGGQVYTYQAGTTTPQATYTDATGSTPNTNPIITNSRGEFQMWLGVGLSYKIIAKDALGNTLWTADNVESPADLVSALQANLASTANAGVGAGMIGIGDPTVNYVRGTIGYESRLRPHLKMWSAIVGDGVADDTAAMQGALNFMSIATRGGGILDAEGLKLRITSKITIPSYVLFRGADWLPDPSNTAQVYHTCIYVDFGSNQAVGSGNHAVELAHSAGIEGFTFYYPGQAAKTASTPVTFDYSISTPVGGTNIDNVHIKNITLYNAYAGINASNGGRMVIEDIQGDPLSIGLNMHGNFDVCYVKKVHFWNFYTQGAALETWVAANGTGFQFGRVDGLQAENLFVWNMKVGVSMIATDSGALWANIKGLVIDTADTPLSIAAASQVNIDGFQLISSAAAKPAIVYGAGGVVNFGQGQITSSASVGLEATSSATGIVTFDGVNFLNQHAAAVVDNTNGSYRFDNCSWAVPPFGQNNVFIDGQPLGHPSTSITVPTITATGNATGSGLNWSFPLTTPGTATIYFNFADMNQRQSIWTLEFNYNLPILATTWYFQVLVQTDVGTFVQVSYAPTYPLILTEGLGAGTPLVRIPIHAGYTQNITRVIVQVITTSGVASAALNLTNIAMYEQDNPHTTDSQVAMFRNRRLYLDAYSMGQTLYAKGKNRRVLSQPQGGYRTNEIPTAGAWLQGDESEVYNPTAAGILKYVCTAAGSPGTWTGLTLS